ncbi:MAG: choice-of-anchor D domain-containing protein [Candidatus Thiodiazotropha sp.]
MADCPNNASMRKFFVTTVQYSSALLLLLHSMSAFAIYSITPASLDFGGIGVGDSSGVLTVTITNQNTADVIELTSITATGDYSIVNNCPTTLDETLSCTVDVRFNPTTSGLLPGSLDIQGFDHSVIFGQGFLPITASVTLSGTGLRGDLVIGSNGVDLGAVPLGTASQASPVTLTNSGNAAVEISTITATAPFAQTSDCPTSLAAGTSCTIMVNVTATTLGAQSGTLTTSGTAPQGTTTQSVSLIADAQGGVLSASPTSLSFPDTAVDTISSAETITVSNQGNASLQNLVVSVTGEFTHSNDCPTTLTPQQSCIISVMAAPVTAGDITGSLEISATSSGQTVSSLVDLGVRGTIADVVTSDTQLSFPDATVDTSSQPQVVSVTNSGTAPLTVNSITTEGDFSQTNDCGTQVAAGASCDIQVVFTPQSSGTATGALNIDTSAGISRIVLSGTAEAAAPSTNPIADLLIPFSGDNPNILSLIDVIAEACPSGRLSDRLQEDCNAVVGAAIDGDINTQVALFQVSPETATKANTTSRQGGETQIRNLGTRISALRAGARGLSFKGLDLHIDEQVLPIELIAKAYQETARRGGGASADNPLLASRLGIFITGDIATGERDETELESGLDFDTAGITIGADYRITNQFILGGAVGFSDTEAELENDAGNLDTQGISLSLFGTYYSPQNYFVDFSATIGANDFDQKRSIVYTLDSLVDVSQNLKADYDGDMVSLFIGSGYDFNRGPWSFGPRADLEYIKSDVDGFTEEVSDPTAAGGGWATRVDETDQRWLTLNLGGKVSYTHSTDWGVLIPYARLDWLHEFEDDSQIITAYFVEDPAGLGIDIQTDDPDRDYLRLRFGTSAQFRNGVAGFIDFGTILSHSEWTAHTISAGVRMEF